MSDSTDRPASPPSASPDQTPRDRLTVHLCVHCGYRHPVQGGIAGRALFPVCNNFRPASPEGEPPRCGECTSDKTAIFGVLYVCLRCGASRLRDGEDIWSVVDKAVIPPRGKRAMSDTMPDGWIERQFEEERRIRAALPASLLGAIGGADAVTPAPSPSSGGSKETRPLVGKAYRDWLDEQEGEIGMRLRDAVAALAPGESLTIHRGHRGGLVITPQTDGSRALAAALRAAQLDTRQEER